MLKFVLLFVISLTHSLLQQLNNLAIAVILCGPNLVHAIPVKTLEYGISDTCNLHILPLTTLWCKDKATTSINAYCGLACGGGAEKEFKSERVVVPILAATIPLIELVSTPLTLAN
ncbi:unnamed protein product [Aspergillus oryzae]|nr:unnamed protein product [Aspergillus oryzae]GMF95481.1 unnamed protein product [Aspergillus oryzae]